MFGCVECDCVCGTNKFGGHHQDQEARPDGLRRTAHPCLHRDKLMGTAKLNNNGLVVDDVG